MQTLTPWMQTLTPEPNLMQETFVGSLWVAAVLCLVRVGAIYGGCWLGCWLGATPVDHRKHMWYSMITQVRPFGILHHDMYCHEKGCVPLC